MANKTKSRRIVLDFDGVISTYKSGWEGLTTINDEPVEGVLEWMAEAQKRGHKLYIYSMRTADNNYLVRDTTGGLSMSPRRDQGINAVLVWLESWIEKKKIPLDIVAIGFPFGKQHFDVYIDDRGWRANGPDTLPDLDNLAEVISPWYKRQESV